MLKMAAAKSIDELMAEIRAEGCDMAVTNDAPLATALNARIDMPHLGPFAYTARQIAGMLQYRVLGRSVLSDVEIVRRIQEILAEEGKIWGFAEVYTEVQNIREIRRYTSRVEDYLHGREKTIYSVFQTLETKEALQNRCDDGIMESFYGGRKVAVIDPENFDQLDRHMLPPIGKYVEIDPIKRGEKYSIGTVYAIGNDRQVAESIVALVGPDNASDTAIVLDSSGPVADAVRAALYRKNIPFKNKLSVRDVPQIRDYLQFINLALSFDTLRAGDVRTVFQSFRAGNIHGLTRKNDGILLRKVLPSGVLGAVPDARTAELIGLMEGIGEHTFEEVRRILDGRFSSSVAIQLESMGLSDRKVNIRDATELSYAVSNISDLRHNEQIPESEKKGVLLADCRNSVYIDRPFVIFAGMDGTWEPVRPGKAYIDYEDLDEYNAKRLAILLQQGMSRIYAVKPVTDGKDTLPCSTFETVFRSKVASFGDICEKMERGSWAEETFEEPSIEGATGDDLSIGDGLPELRFSQSAYKTWKRCPLAFMFRHSLPRWSSEDTEYSKYGNLMHEFAEFAFSHPDVVLSHKGDEGFYADRLMSFYTPLSVSGRSGIDRTLFLTHVKKVMQFLEDVVLPMGAEGGLRDLAENENNRFLGEKGTDRLSEYVEATEYLSGPDVEAKYDIAFGKRIFDFKSGRAKTAGKVAKSLDPAVKPIDDLDVQALFYLYVRGMNHGGLDDTSFTLFFLNKDEKNSKEYLTGGEYDIRKDLVTVKTVDDLGYYALENACSYIADTKGCADFMKVLERDRERVVKAMRDVYDLGASPDDAVPMLIEAFGVTDTKSHRNSAKKIAGKLQRNKYVVTADGAVATDRGNLMEFMDAVSKDEDSARHGLLKRLYDNVKGESDCRKCDYRKICIRENDEGGGDDE